MPHDFNYKELDWEQYALHRPAYPAQLYDLVCEYHQSHGGVFDSALDIGGGIGIIARDFLLKKFKRATLSDPSDDYISQAKLALASYASSKQLSFVKSKIEDMRPSDLPNGPVDLLTAGTSLHWADPLRITPSAAQLLKSGGTFSAWAYGVQPQFADSFPAVKPAWSKLFERMFAIYEEKLGKLTEEGPTANSNARFDNIPFNPKEWTNVRRIQVMPEVDMLDIDLNIPAADKRVLPEVESQEVLENNDFVMRTVDHTWIVGYLRSVVPFVNVEEELAPELKELKSLLGDKEYQLRWPFAIVLATRR
ncbi:uncharacterized protein RCC_07678 [Ramularia collo-cygni]|uniref:Methyltransferase type 11 domain-containing protein n=1 Tax=Ramularia collo-cygni TaxID=112498 RepID=A0A2D3UY47_9PEZI|nr:uncharacterized protein RCC_07678 [Ramularia collo-cygni]CZT21811.1 uncharacterized protein RCC_07678 [Ramularia collo-cygni]